MRVLLTGAGGQLGRELQLTCPAGVTLDALDRHRLDITDRQAVERTFADRDPEVVVNTAAYTAVDGAESEPELAIAVNAVGVRHLVEACRGRTRLVQLSTDFVFSGSSNRPYSLAATPDPCSVYGESKLVGEQEALTESDMPTLVIRTAWLYSRFGHNFVKTMLHSMESRDEITVVDDQIGTPTWARGLAVAVWKAIERPAIAGIHHWTDAGLASWYDFAVAIQDEALDAGILERRCDVRPVPSSDYPTAARRPAFSILDTTATRRALEMEPVHWRRQLRQMLRQLAEHGES